MANNHKVGSIDQSELPPNTHKGRICRLQEDDQTHPTTVGEKILALKFDIESFDNSSGWPDRLWQRRKPAPVCCENEPNWVSADSYWLWVSFLSFSHFLFSLSLSSFWIFPSLDPMAPMAFVVTFSLSLSLFWIFFRLDPMALLAFIVIFSLSLS